MAFEDLYGFQAGEELFAFHTKTAFLVQLDPPTARFLELGGSAKAFLEEYPEQVLGECRAALSELYEEDLLPKELELESRKGYKSPMWALDLRSVQDSTSILGFILKAMGHLRTYSDTFLVVLVGLDQKEKLDPLMKQIPGVRLGVEQKEGIFQFLGETGLKEALFFKPSFDRGEIEALFKAGVLRVWMNLSELIPSPEISLCETVVSFLGKAWEYDPTAKLEPIFSWIRAMYEASPPRRMPLSLVMTPTPEDSFRVRTSPSSASPLSGLDFKEVLSLLEGAPGSLKPDCLLCPIRTLCCGKYRAGGALLDPTECRVAFDLFRASVILYDKLDQDGRLETYLEGEAPKKQAIKIEGREHLGLHSILPESLPELLPALLRAIDGGLFFFERHPDPSLRDIGALLKESDPKRELLALWDAKDGLLGFLWVSVGNADDVADLVLWVTESAFAFLAPMDLKTLLQGLLSFFKLRKIRLFARADHANLRRLYEASGLALEGVQREHLFKDGAWKDVSVYALCNQDRIIALPH